MIVGGRRILASLLVGRVAVTVDGFSIHPASAGINSSSFSSSSSSSSSLLPAAGGGEGGGGGGGGCIDRLKERVASLDSSTLSLQMMDRAGWEEDRAECIIRARPVRPFLPVGPPYGATWARSTDRAHPEPASVISAANSFKPNPISRSIC